ncbi:MAG: MutS-related protein [Acidobacteriota bacterium]
MPAAIYQQRLSACQAELARTDRQIRQLGNVRLLVAAGFLLTLWLSLWWWCGIDTLVFLSVGWRMRLLERIAESQRRAIAYHERALERIAGRWAGTGVAGLAFRPAEHCYANDLDLFGTGSLFEYLCHARSALGQSHLANWLLQPASPATIRERQSAVEEIAADLQLREDLATIGAAKTRDVAACFLLDWGESSSTPFAGAPKLLYGLLSLLGLVAVFALLADLFGSGWPYLRIFYLSVGLAAGFVLFHRRRAIHQVLRSSEGAATEVALIASLLARMEDRQFSALLLQSLRASLESEGAPPSRCIQQLRRYMDFVDSRDHFIVRLLGPLVLWDLHLALALEGWRARHGQALRRWIEAVAAMEALTSLATFRFEHPESIFPTLSPHTPCLRATGLIHPLMPSGQAVANDVELGSPLRLLLVSGSNMSGKSTFMRTIGANLMLAQAGAPVLAQGFEWSPLQIGASISTHDSLQGNISRFYAEILRLRDVMNLTLNPLPVLFLLDEILSGTNSHDRRIGAEAILRNLVGRGAVGIATTHDLALTGIVEELAPRAANLHFEDQLIDGKMQFDYRVRPGVVTHSNAIELMRAIGLEV